MENKVTSNVTKGLIISLILIVLDLVAGFAHFKYASWYRWTGNLVLIAAIIWACISYGAQLNNQVSFGNIFAHGFKTSAVIACILFLYVILSVLVIFPGTKDEVLEQARKQMEAKGNLTDDQVNMALEWTKKSFWPITIAAVVLGTLILGVIASLIGAAVTKKKPSTPFEQQP